MNKYNFQVGDYVLHNGYICKIYGIVLPLPRKEPRYNNKCVVTLWHNGLFDVTIEELEPIPLTEEILKANGWQLLSNYDREAYYDPNGVFSLDFRNGLFRLIIHGNIVIIEHVHQLQHALSICNLNELADNFKLKNDE